MLTFPNVDIVINISTPVEYNLPAQLARLRSAVQRNETVNLYLSEGKTKDHCCT